MGHERTICGRQQSDNKKVCRVGCLMTVGLAAVLILWGGFLIVCKQLALPAGMSPERQTEICHCLLTDLQVFPVLRHTDPEVAFVAYENGWGDARTFGGDRTHEGTDVMGTAYGDGTYPVVSMTDGTVEKLGWLKLGGWRVGVRSDQGIYYYYAHLDSYADGIRQGCRVSAGQELGRMGSTGYSTVEGTCGKFATHLHVGIYVPAADGDDVSINPYYILKYLEQKKVISGTYDTRMRISEGG